ncbi:helix-turn-helix domain-containing protein [Tigheibacillus jepli]|uniref:helix-turn-helix domain-containing protein n=1 Tax=Tigheibacillus jepli TaxID=3035914 RepID=UPI00387E0610
MVKGTHTPLHFIKRAKIILMAADGKGNREISRECHIDRHTVKRWRRCWDDMRADLERTENKIPKHESSSFAIR